MPYISKLPTRFKFVTYPSNMNCTWIISVPSGYSVKLKFKTFEVKMNIELNGMLRINSKLTEVIAFRLQDAMLM